MNYAEKFDLSYIMGLYQQYIKKFPEDQTYKESARFFQQINEGRYIMNKSYVFVNEHPFRLQCLY